MHISINFGLLLIFLCISDVSSIVFLLRPFIPVFRIFNIGRSTKLSDEIIKEVREDIVNKSNHYRKIHGLSGFAMSDTLDSVAQDSATYLAKSNTMPVKKSSENDHIEYGYQITPFKHVGEVLVDWWYMELLKFKKSDEDLKKSINIKTISLTQFLWKNTKEIGIGVAMDRYDNFYHIVVAYRPKGNVIGKYAENEPNFTPEQEKEQSNKKEAQMQATGVDKEEDMYKFKTKGKNPEVPGWKTTLHTKPE